ncbi:MULTISPECIES: pyridoxamine 5'-phosphate oxidase family protein [Parafrankia]|uniref:Pyridoxamine 5'-phosphate oxidase n=1 Tax=Parafrankia soli TaxID=2599596 RepID=A0A1S1QEW3_9ACTN|nr:MULTISPECIES: pyridoxamine 5'-phosphate oxidase family protein [Parafrankia]OHV32197.1 pyridoxamine 5'-phosphate oxidase [Parafrankia soli]TCJ38716.1 pyridoxamine 5'-phosphate oxidase family protein [Parafrankia sp. BMG5.11]CAI7976943.1 Pyridoxamine 5'-phosphate oxidase [Frankia sp. Hr75.2]SQD93800.1 Pyridoxamine 5'-phosphate oxidase-related FMN-binding [Parafrankia sp. Ea1.12]
MSTSKAVSTDLSVTRNYVRDGKVMQIATLAGGGEPAVCNLWYASSFEPDRLFFISRPDRTHCRNIRADRRVAGAIVTIELDGLGQEVQGVSFAGTAEEVPVAEADALLPIYHGRWPQGSELANVEMMLADGNAHRLYEIRVDRWILFDEINHPDDPRRVIDFARAG